MVFNMKISSLKILSTSIALFTGFSVVGFAQSTKAQDATATFTFSHTILQNCDLNTLADDIVTLTPSGNTLVTNNPGTFNVVCNYTGAQINITSITETAESAADTVTATLTRTGGTNEFRTALLGEPVGTPIDLEATNNIFEVELETDHSTNGLTAGSYSYDVVVTVTGNN